MSPAAITIVETQPETIFLNQNNSFYKSVIKDGDDDCHGNEKKSKALIKAALEERVNNIDTSICEPGEEDAFYVADLGQVYRQHMRWKQSLPRVKPHYAVKCNPDPMVLRLLAAMGTGFDCASKAEIDQVLSIGVDPTRIIYAQPCKTRSYIRHASSKNVAQMTFDNTDELHKIAALYPGAELYLRIMTDDSSSLCRLSTKFGAPMDSVPELLALAHKLGLNVVGVSFHVGSGASDPASIVAAVRDARMVFNAAESLGFDMHTLDVGGGFTSELFELFATALTSALETYFPSPEVRIIAEPGRYYVAEAYTLAANVIARREVTDPVSGFKSAMLYLNDGVYGNFSSIIFDHQNPVPQLLLIQDQEEISAKDYSIWGPTCDGIDRITAGTVSFEREIRIGDWLFFEEMGAYTKCSATRFNGFRDDHECVYVCSEPGAQALIDV